MSASRSAIALTLFLFTALDHEVCGEDGEYDFNVALLQTKLDIQSPNESHANEQDDAAKPEASGTVLSATWFDWKSRSQLLGDKHSTPTHTYAHTDTNTHAHKVLAPTHDFAAYVDAWTGLGDNWWMEFVDGFAHKDGPHAFDNFTDGERAQNHIGLFYSNSMNEYARWSSQLAWGHRWNATSLAHVNARHNEVVCKSADCHDMFSCYFPRQMSNVSEVSEEFALPTPVPFNVSGRDVPPLLNSLLSDYYTAVEAAELASTNATEMLRRAIPHLAKLHMLLAELHPFGDGNSRTRTLVLQTELVRLGGHPVVMANNGWEVYSEDLSAHVNSILEGWCAWEVIAITGISPFVARSPFGSPSYDSANGRCRVGI